MLRVMTMIADITFDVSQLFVSLTHAREPGCMLQGPKYGSLVCDDVNRSQIGRTILCNQHALSFAADNGPAVQILRHMQHEFVLASLLAKQ